MTKNFLNEKELNALLNNPNITFKVYDSLISTNKTAKELAENGAKEGTVIVAKKQTGGRGRLGRSFYSPEGTGLYFSIILRPDFSPEQNLLITPAAAVAVSTVIEALTDTKAQIKWVNDIFINGKKVCGILSEAKLNAKGTTEYVILGIGINLTPPKGGFPKDIEFVAGALFNAPQNDTANEIMVKTVTTFLSLYQGLTDDKIYTEYEKRLMLKKAEVNYTENGEVKHGTVLGVDRSFNLIINKADGKEFHLSSGEVTIGSGNLVK
ncbi:MAG: biotin--[Clostridia bacterium]|nr:biotin--[acetyl-CoA-carboxylase] ligase [Clostridia bacterium]